MTTAPVLMTPVPRAEPPAYAVPQPTRHLRLVSEPPQLTIDDIMQRHSRESLQDDDRDFARVRTPDDELAPVSEFARMFFTATAEVLVGRRSIEQLSQYLSLQVQQWLRTLTPRRSAATQAAAPRVRAVHVCRVRDGVVEATAVVQHGPHVKAMNSRFVGLDGRWQAVQLQLV